MFPRIVCCLLCSHTLRIKNILFFFLLFFSRLLLAQEEKFQRIGIDHGITHSVINSICKDKFGFMWFATGNGLCKFDGKRSQVYLPGKLKGNKGLKDHNIRIIRSTPSGNLLLATFFDFYLYNYEQDKFIDISSYANWRKLIKNRNITYFEPLSDSVVAVTLYNKIIKPSILDRNSCPK